MIFFVVSKIFDTSCDTFENPIAKIKRTCYNDANGNAQFPIDKEVLL